MIQSRSYITRKILRQSDEVLIPGLEPFSMVEWNLSQTRIGIAKRQIVSLN